MPSPKSGTVTDDIAAAVEELKKEKLNSEPIKRASSIRLLEKSHSQKKIF